MEFLASLIIILLNTLNYNVDTIPLQRTSHGLMIVPCSFDIGTYHKSGQCLYDTGANISVVSQIEIKDVLKGNKVNYRVLTLQTATGENNTYAFKYTRLQSGNLKSNNGEFIFAPMPMGLLGIVGSPMFDNRNVIILKDKLIVL